MSTAAADGRRHQRIHVRWTIRRDLREILAAERLGRDDPWDEAAIVGRLKATNVIGMVAEVDEIVAGHMVYVLYRDHIVVDRLTVHPGWRGCGVGSALVAKLKSKLSPVRRTRLELVAPESGGFAGVRWLGRRGFVAVGVVREAFADGDGIVMVYRWEWGEQTHEHDRA